MAILLLNVLTYRKYNTSKTSPITDSTYFDLLPSSTIAPFKFIEWTSGNLPAGMVQYCYQLFNVHGGETTTSSLSSMIPVSSSNTNSSKNFNGNNKDESTDKGVYCQLHYLMTVDLKELE